MPAMRTRIALALLALLTAPCACDRNIEPFVPGETPMAPDLSAIFPAGAERAAKPSAGLPPLPGQRADAPVAQVAETAPPIRGSVQLAPELSGSVPPGAVLFLIARGRSPGPPLAVQKIAEPQFPLEFSIGPEDRMISEMPFVGPITISARIDADGNATTRGVGDLQGESPGSHQPGANGVEVLIAEVYSAAPPRLVRREPSVESGRCQPADFRNRRSGARIGWTGSQRRRAIPDRTDRGSRPAAGGPADSGTAVSVCFLDRPRRPNDQNHAVCRLDSDYRAGRRRRQRDDPHRRRPVRQFGWPSLSG